MTNPIPEAAVEAASAALRRTEVWGRLAAYSRMSVKDARSIRDELVTAALTAARPHMEAEIRGRVAGEIPVYPVLEDWQAIRGAMRRMLKAGYRPTMTEWESIHFLNGRLAGWKEAREHITAPIAERTNDEPV